jgi:hypothetical protein
MIPRPAIARNGGPGENHTMTEFIDIGLNLTHDTYDTDRAAANRAR